MTSSIARRRLDDGRVRRPPAFTPSAGCVAGRDMPRSVRPPSDRGDADMAIGPVQLIVLGFEHPEFHGEIIAELERLKASDTVRVIDAFAIHKDADGEIEVAHLSRFSKGQTSEHGSKVTVL